MTEDFLQYIWKFKKFQILNLTDIKGQSLEIIKVGQQNFDAGPDFLGAVIKVDGQLWAGNLEIHTKSSDWRKHKHQNDPAYKNVILHVVYEHDKDIEFFEDNIDIPTLILKGKLKENLYWNYERMLQSEGAIPCASQINHVPQIFKQGMLEQTLVERLEDKTTHINRLFIQNKGDWDQTFYQWLARGFGLKVNAEPLQMLSNVLAEKVLKKHKNDLFQMEALLFGCSGFLKTTEDEYQTALAKEYLFLKGKYKLEELDNSIWKFSRMRPNAFPTLRLAQFAALSFESQSLFSKILSIGDVSQLRSILKSDVSDYWQNHYRFGLPAKSSTGNMGEKFVEILIINVIVPFLFVYGLKKDESFYRSRAVDLLDQIKPEDNKVSRIFKSLNFDLDTAYHSQGAIQLHQNYCEAKKCLNCKLGTHLMKLYDD